MRFNRDVAPPASVTWRGAIASALAMVRQSAAFASPCSGHGTHPHLEHGAAVGAPFDPFDRIAAAARRQPHVDDDAIGCRRPRIASHGGQ